MAMRDTIFQSIRGVVKQGCQKKGRTEGGKEATWKKVRGVLSDQTNLSKTQDN